MLARLFLRMDGMDDGQPMELVGSAAEHHLLILSLEGVPSIVQQ